MVKQNALRTLPSLNISEISPVLQATLSKIYIDKSSSGKHMQGLRRIADLQAPEKRAYLQDMLERVKCCSHVTDGNMKERLDSDDLTVTFQVYSYQYN